jgi:hypothetical protein
MAHILDRMKMVRPAVTTWTLYRHARWNKCLCAWVNSTMPVFILKNFGGDFWRNWMGKPLASARAALDEVFMAKW